MRKVLIVSPHFPPINAPDMQRVRLSLPYFHEFGWEPIVLGVDPACVEGVLDPLLLETFPPDVPVHRVSAFSTRWTRKFGIGSLALRSLSQLNAAGRRVIRNSQVDLAYFSTTMFPVMTLGRVWKQRFGVPFVVDMQDPWVTDYNGNGKKQNFKHRLARGMHRVLEPWTMKHVGGVIAVSPDYISTLRSRYGWIADKPTSTLPFGADDVDFRVLRGNPQTNQFFQRDDGCIHGVYVGRGGQDMEHSLRMIFQALRRGLEEAPTLFKQIRLHFIGTDYAPPERAQKSIEPVAKEMGVQQYIHEHPQRLPYFEAMQLLLDSDFLLIPGSDDAQYTASKVYQYILSRKPIVAVFHENSTIVDVLRRTEAGEVVTFRDENNSEDTTALMFETWGRLLRRLPFQPSTNWREFETYSAREMTRRQCQLFDETIADRCN